MPKGDDVTVEDMLKGDTTPVKSQAPAPQQPKPANIPVQSPKQPAAQPVNAPVQVQPKTVSPQPQPVVEKPKPINLAPVTTAPAAIQPAKDKPLPVAAVAKKATPINNMYSNKPQTSKKWLLILGILLIVVLIAAIGVVIYFYTTLGEEEVQPTVPEAPTDGSAIIIGNGSVQNNDSGEADIVAVVLSEIREKNISIGNSENLSADVESSLEDYVFFEYKGVSTSIVSDANDETLIGIGRSILDDCTSSFMVYAPNGGDAELYEVFKDSGDVCSVRTSRLDGSIGATLVQDFPWSVNGSSEEYSDEILSGVPLEIYNKA